MAFTVLRELTVSLVGAGRDGAESEPASVQGVKVQVNIRRQRGYEGLLYFVDQNGDRHVIDPGTVAEGETGADGDFACSLIPSQFVTGSEYRLFVDKAWRDFAMPDRDVTANPEDLPEAEPPPDPSTTVRLLPPGGTTGQALLKTADSDYTTGWGTVDGDGGGVALSDDDPQPPGTASAGDGTEASRDDHVHPAQAVPEASNADPHPPAAAAAQGTSDRYARQDHAHLQQTIPAAQGGPAELNQIGSLEGVGSGYTQDTRTRSGVNVPVSLAAGTMLVLDVAFSDTDHRTIGFRAAEFRAAAAVDSSDLTGGAEFRQVLGGTEGYVMHFFREGTEVVFAYEAPGIGHPGFTLSTVLAPRGETGPAASVPAPFAITTDTDRTRLRQTERTITVGLDSVEASAAHSAFDSTLNTIDLVGGAYIAVVDFGAYTSEQGAGLYTANDRAAVFFEVTGTGVVSAALTNNYLRTIASGGPYDQFDASNRAVLLHVPSTGSTIGFRIRGAAQVNTGPYIGTSRITIFPL
ncbi:MAG: hypothetical protein OXM88_02670 [bacterium]|nr:hypothetical protein [bacterium]